MSIPQVELHGKRLFLTPGGHISGDGFGGVMLGKYGDTGSDILGASSPINDAVLEDDFLGAAISASFWTVAKGSDGAAANFAVLAAQLSGVVRATSGAGAGGTMAVNGVLLASGLNWKGAQGGLTFEFSVKPSILTNICMFFGFANTLALTMPFTNAADVITANEADAVGFSFDSSATTQRTNLVGVNNSGTPQQQILPTSAPNSGAPDTAAFHRYRINVVNASMDCDFYIDGTQVGSRMLAAARPSIALTPCITIFTRTAASATLDCDWGYVRQNR